MATSLTYLLPKDTWTEFTKVGDYILISHEEGSLAYWRLGTNAQTLGTRMEIGDAPIFTEDSVWIKSTGTDTKITVVT